MRFALGALACLLTAPGARADASPSVHVDEAPGSTGPSGLLHTPSAVPSPPGMLHGALIVEGASASNWLCTRARPCGNGASSDRHRHTGATAIVAGSPARGVDLWLATRARADDNTAGAQAHSVLGETTLGVRLARRLAPRLDLGAAAEVMLGGGSGEVGVRLEGTSVRLRTLGTLRLDPLRVHLGVAYTFDNTAALVRGVERDRGQELSRIERQGLGIQRNDRLEPRVGVELLGLGGVVRPFAELGLGIAVDRQRFECPTNPADPADCSAPLPSRFTLGVRAWPLAHGANSVSVLAALDLGTGGVRSFSPRLAPEAPWTAWLGLSMSTSASEWGPQVIVERVEVRVGATMVSLKGFVHPLGKDAPVREAIVRFVSGPAHRPLATDDAGLFGAELPPGAYELEIRAPGYKPATCGGLAIASKGQPSALVLDCPLEPDASTPPPER
jgi:hypothetical protein